MKRILQSISAILAVLFVFTACELTTSPDDLVDASETVGENMDKELKVVDVFENVNNFGFNKDGLKSASLLGNEPEASWSADYSTLTLDFTNVANAQGQIIVVFSGTPGYTSGLDANVTFVDYVNDGTALDGEIVFTITDFSSANALFGMKTTGYLTITESGITYDWSCDQTLNWYEGVSSLGDNSDDSFLINGNTEQKLDTLVNTMVLTDIDKKADCEFIVDGEMVLVQDAESDNSMEVTIDFGIDKDGNDSGDCDGWVKLSSGGITLKVDLE